MMNLKFNRWGYRTKLTFFFSLAFTSMVVIQTFTSYVRETDKIRNDTLKARILSAEQAAKNLEDQLFILSRLTFSLVSNKDIYDPLLAFQKTSGKTESRENMFNYAKNSEKLSSTLTSYIISWERLSGLTIYTLGGYIYYYLKDQSFDRDYNFKEDDWFKQINADSFSSMAYIGRNSITGSNISTLSFVRRIVDLDTGTFLGYLKADMDMDNITEELLNKPINASEGNSFYILDRSNTIIASSDTRLKGTSCNISYKFTDVSEGFMV